jgi:ssRNA-specific RNase YbeY (16S rRNA maturation enzyme)
MINLICPSRYKINRKLIREKVKVSSALTVNVVFVGKIKMRQISKQYKKDEILHPVLSFFYPEENTIEVFICYQQAVLLAAQRNKPVDAIIVCLIDHGINNFVKK